MRPIAFDARRVVAGVMAALLLVGLIQLSPAQAAEPPMDVLASGRDTTSRWTAYKIRSDGGQYRLNWKYSAHQGPLQMGAYVYNGDDAFTAGFTWTAFTYQDSSYHEVNVVPGRPIVGEPTIDADGYTQTLGIGGFLFGAPGAPKFTKILIWASGDLKRGSEWELKATRDAHVATDGTGEVAITTGTEAFVHLSGDFEGAAKAGIQRRLPSTPVGNGGGVRTGALTSKTVEVKHALVGGFAPLGVGSPYSAQGYALQVSGPNQFEQTCQTKPCVWYPLKAPEALPAGTYRFDLTGGGAGIGTFGDAMLWGVDAHLPAGGDPGPTPTIQTASVSKLPGGVSVSGGASFPSTAITTAGDPEDDGAGPIGAADVLGAELSGGGLTYNPDRQNLSIRWDLSTHDAGAVGTLPGVQYASEFLVGDTRYQVRAMRAAATSSAPSPNDAQVYMALFRCAQECTEQRRLTGSFSWPVRNVVLVEVPLSAISAGEGSQLTGLRNSAAVGEASPGAVMAIDEVRLPSAVIPESRVELGIAPASVAEGDVTFDARASLSGGAFSGTVSTDGLAAGDYRMWARACLGVVCGSATPLEVAL
jgi:hypothetical protein